MCVWICKRRLSWFDFNCGTIKNVCFKFTLSHSKTNIVWTTKEIAIVYETQGKGETFKMKINFIFVIRLSRFFLIFNSWSCSIEHNNSCIVIVFIVLTSCRSISNLVPMQSLRSRWPAIGKQLNQEKPDLKSKNIGLPFELRILVVKTNQNRARNRAYESCSSRKACPVKNEDSPEERDWNYFYTKHVRYRATVHDLAFIIVTLVIQCITRETLRKMPNVIPLKGLLLQWNTERK